MVLAQKCHACYPLPLRLQKVKTFNQYFLGNVQRYDKILKAECQVNAKLNSFSSVWVFSFLVEPTHSQSL